jgi:aldose 1-epimerase
MSAMSADAAARISCAVPGGTATALIGLHGGGIREFQYAGRDVIPQDTEASRIRWFSGATLAPWPNRLGNARWTFEGETLTARANDLFGNALHGLAFDRDFEVVEQQDDRMTVACLLGDDAAYPFAVRVSLTYVIAEDGLTCTMAAQNLSPTRVPFAFGAHPYFPFDDHCTITITAHKVWEVDDRKIPTGRLVEPSLWGVVPGMPTALSAFVADDCFTELERDERGLAHTVLTYADGWRTDIWQGPGMDHTMIFTTRESVWRACGDHAIGIEAQTAPTDALNSGIDLVWLGPTEEFAVQWGITVTPGEAARGAWMK